MLAFVTLFMIFMSLAFSSAPKKKTPVPPLHIDKLEPKWKRLTDEEVKAILNMKAEDLEKAFSSKAPEPKKKK